ncbi:hypothetical protein SBRCBS47491_003971 [Sporothrix bragantina]|uniref:Transmembrane protein n=1 Tax=Sporothrix bragantina TaxID=671064 RepID=A0ABP0BJI8_9PEZI
MASPRIARAVAFGVFIVFSGYVFFVALPTKSSAVVAAPSTTPTTTNLPLKTSQTDVPSAEGFSDYISSDYAFHPEAAFTPSPEPVSQDVYTNTYDALLGEFAHPTPTPIVAEAAVATPVVVADAAEAIPTRPLNQAEIDDPRLLDIPEAQRHAFHYTANGVLVPGPAPNWGVPAGQAPKATYTLDADLDGVDGTLTALERFKAEIGRGQSTIEHQLSAFDMELDPSVTRDTTAEAHALLRHLQRLSANTVEAAADLESLMKDVQGKRKTMQQLADITDFRTNKAARDVWLAENPEVDALENVKRGQTARPKLVKHEENSDDKYTPPEDKFPWMKDASTFGMHLYR